MREKWSRWEPLNDLKEKYYIDQINDGEDFVIKLSDEGGKEEITLTWEGYVDSYMCSEEIVRTLKYENEELKEWTFFKVKNSEYLKWLEQQSLGIVSNEEEQHFCIIGINSYIDIISKTEPIVTRKV